MNKFMENELLHNVRIFKKILRTETQQEFNEYVEALFNEHYDYNDLRDLFQFAVKDLNIHAPHELGVVVKRFIFKLIAHPRAKELPEDWWLYILRNQRSETRYELLSHAHKNFYNMFEQLVLITELQE